jgi:hypothetical protein
VVCLLNERMMDGLASLFSRLTVGDPNKLRKSLHKEYITYRVKTERYSDGGWVEYDSHVEINFNVIKEIPLDFVSRIWNGARGNDKQRIEAMVALALFTSASDEVKDAFDRKKKPDFYVRTKSLNKSDGYFSMKTREGEVIYRAFVQKTKQ